ncbi:MAG: ribonuclease PH [Candidatus Puniceispirillum sp.]|nr:ribonuclease PH [Candidatus Pelagibacter sp.]MBA4283185.1 ribonuclease PH [Candidatus Puniceispirillum sp.]
MYRKNKRQIDQLRSVFLGPNFVKHAEGSCFVKFGDTHVICAATIEEKVPPFIRNTGAGWITAEYGMLPRSTKDRMDREAVKGKQQGRTQEIQRLIGRSLRSIVDLKMLGERQIKIDCDVIQADGGTRTAAITGSFVALKLAIQHLLLKKKITQDPIKQFMAAISVGVVDDECVLDMDFEEDSKAFADGNFVFTESGDIIEMQISSEKTPITKIQSEKMFEFAQKGIAELIEIQKDLFKKK